jgi:hypothetical protein
VKKKEKEEKKETFFRKAKKKKKKPDKCFCRSFLLLPRSRDAIRQEYPHRMITLESLKALFLNAMLKIQNALLHSPQHNGERKKPLAHVLPLPLRSQNQDDKRNVSSLFIPTLSPNQYLPANGIETLTVPTVTDKFSILNPPLGISPLVACQAVHQESIPGAGSSY